MCSSLLFGRFEKYSVLLVSELGCVALLFKGGGGGLSVSMHPVLFVSFFSYFHA